MNKLEEIVYHALYNHPTLKLFVRNMYQGVFDIMPRKANFIANDYDMKEGYFFGFHDISPISRDETKVLAQEIAFDFRMPNPNEGINIGFFDFDFGKIGKFHQIGTSYAWNYHKGCRLQWLDNHRIIYNTSENNVVFSKIVNIQNNSEQNLPYPIDSVFVNGVEELATTFSYERLQFCMPGYGYPYSDESFLNKKYPSETGLFLMDLHTEERKLVVSLAELVDRFCNDDPTLYYHYVTHTEFSKDGRYIAFLYRRKIDGGDINKRITMIIVYDRVNDELILLPSQVSGSHYVWNDKNQIIASCIIDGKSCHVLFDMNDVDNFKIIAPSILNQDGHQTFVNDDVFITDTYPDKWRQVQLYKVRIDDGKVEKILSVNSPKKFLSKSVYNYIDCDLHPRVSPSGRYVCCDVCYTGKRSLFIMAL